MSYHLKRNLWLDDSTSRMQLAPDVSSDLDIAILARREGLPGKKTPDGLLTRLCNTSLGALLNDIEKVETEITTILSNTVKI